MHGGADSGKRGRRRRLGAAERRQERAQEQAGQDFSKVGSEFYVVAVLSLIGSLMWWARTPSLEEGRIFFGALAFTFFVDALMTGLAIEFKSGAPMVVAGVVNAFAIFTFALIGFFTQRRARFAFWAGVVLYVIDTGLAGLILLIGEPIGFIMVGFHCFILFTVIKRWRAGWAALPAAAATGGAPPQPATLGLPAEPGALEALEEQAEGVFDLDPRARARARERARQRRKRRE